MEKLTQQEEDAMQVIWETGGGIIKDFLLKLPEPQPPYTTLASTVKNLERKGFVEGEKLGNTYRYSPRIKAEEYKKKFMKGFVGDYFQNSYKELVAFFVKEKQLSPQELKEIMDMIQNQKPE